MLRSISKQSGESGESVGGKDLQKREVLSLEWKTEGVMDDWESWVNGTDGRSATNSIM